MKKHKYIRDIYPTYEITTISSIVHSELNIIITISSQLLAGISKHFTLINKCKY